MLTHALRAVPWPLVLPSSLLIMLMLTLLGRWPGPLWALGGVAVGMVAGSVAWCLDEPVPEIADTAARPLRWRLTAAGLGIAVVGAGWVGGVILAGDLFGRQGDVLRQGLSALVAVSGGIAWLRSRGSDHPGRVLAPYLVLITTGLALTQPLPQQLPLFPSPIDGSWAASSVLWAVLASLGAAGLLLAATDAQWWHAGETPNTGRCDVHADRRTSGE